MLREKSQRDSDTPIQTIRDSKTHMNSLGLNMSLNDSAKFYQDSLKTHLISKYVIRKPKRYTKKAQRNSI